MSRTHWTILGAGSLGCLWGGYLNLAGMDVTLIHRPQTQAPDSLALTLFQTETETAFDATLTTAQACPAGSIHQLIVATKAPDALQAVQGIAHALADDAVILVLQNGMGAQQAVAEAFSDYAIIAACITDGAYRSRPGHVVHAGRGISRVGALNDKGKAAEHRILDQLNRMALDVEACPDIHQALWNKLAINIAINGLTALDQCLNGELKAPERLIRVKALCEETEAVMRALSLSLPEGGLFALAMSVIEGTARNRSSMLQDTLNGKSTEVKFINGYLLQQADRLGLSAPENQAVYDAVIARFHQDNGG